MDYLKAFVIGASFPVPYITLNYVKRAYNAADEKPDVSLQTLNVGIQIAYGLANMVNIHFGNTFQSAISVGAVFGEILSLIGRYKYDLPVKIFKFSSSNAWKVHIIAPVLYAFIFGTLIYVMNKIFI